jgi:hypothetical protein
VPSIVQADNDGASPYDDTDVVQLKAKLNDSTQGKIIQMKLTK